MGTCIRTRDGTQGGNRQAGNRRRDKGQGGNRQSNRQGDVRLGVRTSCGLAVETFALPATSLRAQVSAQNSGSRAQHKQCKQVTAAAAKVTAADSMQAKWGPVEKCHIGHVGNLKTPSITMAGRLSNTSETCINT